jgi:hypothetical protein
MRTDISATVTRKVQATLQRVLLVLRRPINYRAFTQRRKELRDRIRIPGG